MADKEMRDESSAALLAALSKPMEVEAWGIEQESGSCAAPMEAEGSAPGSLAHEKTQPTPERTGPIHVEKDSNCIPRSPRAPGGGLGPSAPRLNGGLRKYYQTKN